MILLQPDEGQSRGTVQFIGVAGENTSECPVDVQSYTGDICPTILVQTIDNSRWFMIIEKYVFSGVLWSNFTIYIYAYFSNVSFFNVFYIIYNHEAQHRTIIRINKKYIKYIYNIISCIFSKNEAYYSQFVHHTNDDFIIS